MSEPRKIQITYKQHPGVTPEGEREVLACVYRYVLECGEKRSATEAKNRGKDLESRSATDR
jgi:hypothetical protein